MRYLVMLIFVFSFTFAQQKESQQRYVIYLMNSDVEKISFQHIQVPTIGTPKQVPIKLDTWTGDTWMLDSNLEIKNGKNVITYRWVKIETDETALSSK